jgi:hypothetical protein
MIYLGSCPFLEVIPYIQRFAIKDEQRLQWSEQRAREVHVMKGVYDLVPLPKG